MTIDDYIALVTARPKPTNPISRVKTFARELAEGASYELWGSTFSIVFPRQGNEKEEPKPPVPDSANLKAYITARWGLGQHPGYDLLLRQEYTSVESSDWFRGYYALNKSAFDLLTEVEQATIFISYKRSESSAFALLIARELEQAGLAPFLDMQLRPGDDWRHELENNIKNADYFILLLGNSTWQSEVTMEEVAWALAAQKPIISIRHNGFKFDNVDWSQLPDDIAAAIQRTHSIEVTQENPLAYHSALTELLNRFGITR